MKFKTPLILVLVMVFALLLCGAASAGTPLLENQTGTVSGDLYYNASNPWAQTTQGETNEVTQANTLPTYTSIDSARVYVNVYSGSGVNNWPVRTTVKFDGNGDGDYDDPGELLGVEDMNIQSSADGTVYWLNDHCTKVYSDYHVWYDVKNLITSNNPSVYVKTESLGGDYDGRIKLIALIAAYNDGDNDQVHYWVLNGQDWINSGSATSTFNTSSFNGQATNATLNTVALTSTDGTYTFNNHAKEGNLTEAGTYYKEHTWDVTSDITPGADSNLTYTNLGSSFKINLATLTIREETLPTGLADTPWPKFKGNSNNTGQSPYNGPSTNNVVWTYTTGYYIFYSGPVIGLDGTIYIGSQDSKLHAVNPDGTLKWNYTAGGRIEASPAIASDGTIYFGSEDGKFYALNPDGTLKWSYGTGTIYSSPAIGEDGTIYIGSTNGKLYAFNQDGTVQWTYTTGNGVVGPSNPSNSSPAIGEDGTIYIGSTDGNLYALNPDGTLKWSYTTGGVIVSAPAIGSDGTIYFGCNDKNIYAINPDGTLKWNYTTGNSVIGSPAVASDGTIYVGSQDKIFYALNPDGTLKWSYAIGSSQGYIMGSAAIGADGTIYFGCYNSSVYALNINGTLKWSYGTGGWMWSTPAIGSDGTLYVASRSKNLYAIKDAITPLASFNSSVTNGTEGYIPLTVQFTDTSSNYPTSWLWNFGDGTTSTIKNPSHTYSTPGTYTVTLTVSNNAGTDDEIKTDYITVNTPTTPIADFTATPTYGGTPLTVQFMDQSTGVNIAREWDFNNDGITDSTLQNPSWTYPTAGNYTVKLTVSNAGGDDTEIKTDYITVITDTQAPTVTATPIGGTINATTQVILSATDDFNTNPTIYYTLDGTDPTTNSIQYTNPINITKTTTLKFIATDDYGNISPIQTESYMDIQAPTTSANPISGNYTVSKTVILSVVDDVDPNPKIYYTLDGTDPTTTSTLYTDPISITETTTLKFMAIDATGNMSTTVTETYNITDTEVPIVTSKQNGATINLKATDNVDPSPNIYYTLDGTDPTTTSIFYIYTHPISLGENTILKFIAVDKDGNISPVQTETYNITDTDAPIVNATQSENTVNLTATDNTDPNPKIYYTTDGTNPTTSSTPYNAPINLPENTTTTIRFIAVDSTGNTSPVKKRTFVTSNTGDRYNGGRFSGGQDLVNTSVYKEGYIGVRVIQYGSYTWFQDVGTANFTTSALNLPLDATILSARLYQGWTWYGYPGFTVAFNGHEAQNPTASYGDCINGQDVFDVTPYFKVTGDNTAVITAGRSQRGYYATVLVVIYESTNEPYRQIWVNEGSDCLLYPPANGYTMFDNVNLTKLASANLITVTESGNDDPQDQIILNEETVTAKTGGTPIEMDPAFRYYNITNYLQNGTNELGVVPGSYMNFSIAVLEITKDIKNPNVTANVKGGIYGDSQIVNLNANDDQDPNPIIYYTTDGTTPFTSSAQYTGPITISNTTTLKFIAVDSLGNVSPVQTYRYIIDTIAPTVTQIPKGGLYNSSFSVILSADDNIDPHPTIYYTTNGGIPTTNSNLYSGPISINSSTTLRFIAVDIFGNTSPIQSETYTIDNVSPSVNCNLQGKLFKNSQTVTLTATDDQCSTPKIYYTLNGEEPTTNSTLYIGPIVINETATLKFMAVDDAGNTSPAQTEIYTIDTITPTATVFDPVNGKTNIAADKNIKVTFSEDIKKGHMWIELLNSKLTAIPFTATINGKVLTVDPTSNLAESLYTLWIHTGAVTDLAGNPVAVKSTKFSVGTSPIVSSVDPTNNMVINVANKALVITFSENIKTGSAFTSIKVTNPDGVSVKPLYKVINGKTLTLTRNGYYINGLTYTITLPTGSITDTAGNAITAFTSKFTVDFAKPTITSVNPTNNMVINVANRSLVITFSENIKAGSAFTNIKVTNPDGVKVKPLYKAINGKTLTLTRNGYYINGLTYTITLPTGSITDTAGNTINTYTSKFTVDFAKPTITSVNPRNNSSGFSLTAPITITFNENILEGVNWSKITMKNLNTGKAVSFTKTKNGKSLTIKMTYTRLHKNTYQIYIPAEAVKDNAGNKQNTPYTLTFKTR